MSKVVDGGSIPYYNDNKELIASYNTFYNTLYCSLKLTPGEREKILGKINKKARSTLMIVESTTPEEREKLKPQIKAIEKVSTEKVKAKKSSPKKIGKKTKADEK